MRLTELTVDGFGVLGNVELDDLQPGLNVIHGPNGSGKTTLLQFLRGVWCGFDDARRRRFLPPLAGGHPGGAIEVAQGERRYRVTRQALPNGTDRLAVSIRRGTLDDTASVRGTIESLSTELVHLLYAVGGQEAHALDRLLELAHRDGISLHSQRRKSTRFDARLTEVRERREILLGGDDREGETVRLREACREAGNELASAKAEADRLREQLAERFADVIAQAQTLAGRIEWLDLECQSLRTDLSETEGRTVVEAAPGAVESSIVVECHPHDDLQQRVHEIDQRISQARAVLEDLARNRMSVSVESARIAGDEPANLQGTLHQQRTTLRALEQGALELRAAATMIADQRGSGCRCGELETRIQQSVRAMQQQMYLLCQQISRQEQAQRQTRLLAEKSRLDSCESELIGHISRLRRERGELLSEGHNPGVSILRHQTHGEKEHCDCHEHAQFADRATAKVRLQVSPVERPPVLRADPRRPGWRQRLTELTIELEQTRSAWRDAVGLQDEWEVERARLIVLERRMAEQEIEVARRDHMLGEKLDEGQSLLLVEAGLEKMRDSIYEDEPAQVIAEASQLLSELTGGRYPTLLVTTQPLELTAVNDSGIAIPFHALSRGMLDQVGLSLRIAVAAEYSRRGVNLPLVMDDVLSDSDPDRVDLAVHILRRAAEQRQIVFFTCQEHLAARFEAGGVTVRDFPGTRRNRRSSSAAESLTARTSNVPEAPITLNAPQAIAQLPESGTDAAAMVSGAIHSAEPHWLRVDGPVGSVPSIGEQMSRRLAAAGVRTIGDLIELDPEESVLPIDSLQISPSQWRIWQAEGRLLTCVPQLTGREAQLLAAVGILLPQELAGSDADTLVRKIDRLRGDGRSGWVMTGFVWPDRNIVAGWIENAHKSRTFREACESAGWASARSMSTDSQGIGRRRSRSGRRMRIDQASAHRGPRIGSRSGHRRRATASLGGAAREFSEHKEWSQRADVGLGESPDSGAHSGELSGDNRPPEDSTSMRFYLELQSPVVDAPSIGPTTARRLERVGVMTVADLLNRDAQQVAVRLQHRRISADQVRLWQDQSRLMCQVPGLRGHDVQVLVACGLRDPESVGRLSPQALFEIVGPFVATKEGQRLLRSARSPDLAEVADWITWAQQARALRAA